jgi:hypothetical protein
MKNLLNFAIIFICNITFAQVEVKEGIPLEYNDIKEISFKIFKPALRLNKIQKQSNIDYSKVEGLLQSYFSATDSIWDKSDYFDKTHKSVKDNEHYNSVKQSNPEKEYIEIESIYEFTHNGKKMNYVKYAITIDGLPFQVVAVLSCVEIDKRWYVDNLFNQSNIISLLSKLNSEKLGLLFQSDKSNNEIINKIKEKCSFNGIMDINLLYNFYLTEYKNSESIYMKEIRDERNWIENYHYPKAEINILPVINIDKLSMPFSLDNAVFSVYDKDENLLTNTPQLIAKMKNKVEKSLIPNSPETIKLIHKLKFTYNNSICYLIKYQKNNKFYLESLFDDGKRNDNNEILFKNLKKLMFKLKSSTFIDLNSSNTLSKELENIRLLSKNQTEGMLNLSILNEVIEKNKISMSKYLDE